VTECFPQFGFGSLFRGSSGGGGGSGLRVASIKSVKPQYRANAKRDIVRYGPLDLAGKDSSKPSMGSLMAMDPKGQAGIVRVTDGICKSCSILSARFFLTNEDGTEAVPANDVYIHHFVSYDISKSVSDPIFGCDGGFPLMGEPFIDRGQDSGDTDTYFTPLGTNSEDGYHMDSGGLVIQYDLVNYSTQSKKIYINLEYEYKDGQRGKNAGHSLKSVTCNGAIPPKVSQTGVADTSSIPMFVSRDATIIWARGHLHAGGTKMVLNIDGKPACTSTPSYNEHNVITNMTLCPVPFDIKRGSTISLLSEYDLTKHPLRESTSGHGGAAGKFGGSDVMGMFAFSYTY